MQLPVLGMAAGNVEACTEMLADALIFPPERWDQCHSTVSFQDMIISGLQPETSYSLTVTAYTTKGDGARSKPKLVSTTGAGN